MDFDEFIKYLDSLKRECEVKYLSRKTIGYLGRYIPPNKIEIAKDLLTEERYAILKHELFHYWVTKEFGRDKDLNSKIFDKPPVRDAVKELLDWMLKWGNLFDTIAVREKLDVVSELWAHTPKNPMTDRDYEEVVAHAISLCLLCKKYKLVYNNLRDLIMNVINKMEDYKYMEYVKVKVIKTWGDYLAVDGRRYWLEEGKVLKLPELSAKWLAKKGIVEILGEDPEKEENENKDIQKKIEELHEQSPKFFNISLDVCYGKEYILDVEAENVRILNVSVDKKTFDEIVKGIVFCFRYAQGGYTPICNKYVYISLLDSKEGIKVNNDSFTNAIIRAYIVEEGVYVKVGVGYGSTMTCNNYLFFEVEDRFLDLLYEALISKDLSSFFSSLKAGGEDEEVTLPYSNFIQIRNNILRECPEKYKKYLKDALERIEKMYKFVQAYGSDTDRQLVDDVLRSLNDMLTIFELESTYKKKDFEDILSVFIVLTEQYNYLQEALREELFTAKDVAKMYLGDLYSIYKFLAIYK